VNAAKAGNLEFLQWARANGCPWNSSTLLHACDSGDLELVRWTIENNCDWVENALYHLGKAGHFDILDYLYEKKFWPRKSKDTESILLAGAMGGQKKIFDYLNSRITNELHPHHSLPPEFNLLVQPLSAFLETPEPLTRALWLHASLGAWIFFRWPTTKA
jgi:hypothetical protein